MSGRIRSGLQSIWRVRQLRLAVGIGVALLCIAAWQVKTSGMLSPGPLTAVQMSGVALAGYDSHATFEQECKHCHGPVHCVVSEHCTDCHREIAQQRSDNIGLHGSMPGTDQCATCHFEHTGNEGHITTLAMPNLNHERLTDFSLVHHATDYEGKAIGCDGCHGAERYSAEFLTCTGCHESADTAFMRNHTETYGMHCTDCHDGADRMIDFRHDGAFVIDGAHVAVDCTGCHDDKVYHGKSANCSDCHEPSDHHATRFGQHCQRCHTTQAWQPAQLLAHDFSRVHGAAERVACTTCHSASYTSYSCYGCHEHTPKQVAGAHRAAEILDDTNCMGCHRDS